MEDDQYQQQEPQRKGNVLNLWGNNQSMNLNSMILTNILQSPYFKTELVELHNYHEVIDEIYYKVQHLEPWERGSRRTSGLTGMCGGVRGVGEGGIVSTPYCLLYKLFSVKLTRKQLHSMLDHPDSPYIRALGFMYIRYCIQPKELWSWYEPYLEDEEELDVKAGGGCVMTIGQMLHQWLTKLDWCGTLFPRIPVPVQKDIEQKLKGRAISAPQPVDERSSAKEEKIDVGRERSPYQGREKKSREDPSRSDSRGREHGSRSSRSHERHRDDRRRSHSGSRHRGHRDDRSRSRSPKHNERSSNSHRHRDKYSNHHKSHRRDGYY